MSGLINVVDIIDVQDEIGMISVVNVHSEKTDLNVWTIIADRTLCL